MKPKAHIDTRTSSLASLKKMLDEQPELYDKCISTFGFAFGFSQLVNRAIHFDYCMQNGIIPKSYLDGIDERQQKSAREGK